MRDLANKYGPFLMHLQLRDENQRQTFRTQLSNLHQAETSAPKMVLHHLSFSATAIFILIILLILKLVKISKSRRGTKLPPQPWKLPLVGNLHQLAGSLPHVALRDLANKYGPLMHLQLGEVSTMVVSSSEVAKEVMKTHDIIFASRPHIIATKIVSYDSKNFSFAPYGDYWKELRRIFCVELLSTKRVFSFKFIREDEMVNLIKFISSKAGKSVDLFEKNLLMNCDIIAKAAFGKSMKHSELFLSVLSNAAKLASGFCVEDLFPSLTFLHHICGSKSILEANHRELDRILESIISEHDGTQDLLHALLELQYDPEHQMTSSHVKAILDVLFGGIDTSATLVHWAMAELMKNPNLLEKVQAEVRQIYDQQGLVDESKLHELKYMNLVIKEIFRLHPPLPLLLPRLSSEKCLLNGYEVPANTKLIINAWAISRDSKYWVDPEEFRPDRFVDSSVQFNGNDFEFKPFGAGRRMCPGVNFGLNSVEYFLANMLFHFDWKLPNGMQPSEIDMTESFGVMLTRKVKLMLIPLPYERSSLVGRNRITQSCCPCTASHIH